MDGLLNQRARKAARRGLLAPAASAGIENVRGLMEMITGAPTAEESAEYDALTPKVLSLIKDGKVREALTGEAGTRQLEIMAPYAMGMLSFGDIGNIKGKHASPHKFDKFDLSHIGKGEGAQAYGHGGYMAENDDVVMQYYRKFNKGKDDIQPDAEAIAKIQDKWDAAVKRMREIAPDYRTDKLDDAGKQEYRALGEKLDQLNDEAIKDTLDRKPELLGAHLYEVELDAKPEEMLDWDKPITEQPIYKTLEDAIEDPDIKEQFMSRALSGMDGAQAYHNFFGKGRGGADASAALREKGIKGIRYLDGNSRGKGEGTYNYVFFDDKDARILTRDGEPIKGLLSEGADDAARAAYKAEFGDLANRSEDIYHASTHDIEAFKHPGVRDTPYSPESHHGKGIYASSDPSDAGKNYVDGGADLTNRIERRAELLEQDLEMDYPDLSGDEIAAKAMEQAKSELKGPHQGAVYPIRQNMKKPVVVDMKGKFSDKYKKEQTFWDFAENYDPDLDEYGEATGEALNLVDALEFRLSQRDVPQDAIEELKSKLFENMYDNEGISAFDFEQIVRESDAGMYALDSGGDDGAIGQILQEIYRDLGHDGVVMRNAQHAFPGMKLNDDTTHYTMFEPENVRSRFAKFDPTKRDSADILAGIGAGGLVAGGLLTGTKDDEL